MHVKEPWQLKNAPLSSIIIIQVFWKTWLNRWNNELSHTSSMQHACSFAYEPIAEKKILFITVYNLSPFHCGINGTNGKFGSIEMETGCTLLQTNMCSYFRSFSFFCRFYSRCFFSLGRIICRLFAKTHPQHRFMVHRYAVALKWLHFQSCQA